jgi:hypothetical protein
MIRETAIVATLEGRRQEREDARSLFSRDEVEACVHSPRNDAAASSPA